MIVSSSRDVTDAEIKQVLPVFLELNLTVLLLRQIEQSGLSLQREIYFKHPEVRRIA